MSSNITRSAAAHPRDFEILRRDLPHDLDERMEERGELYENTASSVPGGFSKRPLTERDAAALSALFGRQPAPYLRFFSAFAFDEASLAKMLAAAKEDVFGGFYREEEMVGFYMLRGWDEGYEIPALGVLIDQKLRGVHGYRLMNLTVEIGKNLCRLRGTRRIMYKAHPDNTPARSARRWGFTQTGVDERNGYHIFHLDLAD